MHFLSIPTSNSKQAKKGCSIRVQSVYKQQSRTRKVGYARVSSIDESQQSGLDTQIQIELSYLAVRVSMDTGIRPGSMRKLKWKNISENTTIPKEERKIWVNIDVPAEKTKTGRSYRVAAFLKSSFQDWLQPIALIHDCLKVLPNDMNTAKERIKHEFVQVCKGDRSSFD